MFSTLSGYSVIYFEELLVDFRYLLQNTDELLGIAMLYCTLIFEIVFTRV